MIDKWLLFAWILYVTNLIGSLFFVTWKALT